MSASVFRVSSIALVLGLCTAMTPAAARADFCAPLPVAQGDVCQCNVQNYGGKADTNVTIKVYSRSGVVETCSGLTVNPGKSEVCFSQFPSNDVCGCTVSGEARETRSSLSVGATLGSTAETSVRCD